MPNVMRDNFCVMLLGLNRECLHLGNIAIIVTMKLDYTDTSYRMIDW